MALHNTDDKDSKILASKIANKWICTNYVAYKRNCFMFEKYRVDAAGKMGLSTSECPIQDGFGWTNGIVLEFMQMYNSTASVENWKITAQSFYDELTNLTIFVQ
ncbi:unnamed protein product [Macrosiphum euphorbiae]|uniref:Trehalase n=1 Tax=Macrosiphum euphorbiae TaxID=13131 RepID=A0AAV0XV63_9HEMI|nr:unnamed protein product [Macrosiphum euphorbiae]